MRNALCAWRKRGVHDALCHREGVCVAPCVTKGSLYATPCVTGGLVHEAWCLCALGRGLVVRANLSVMGSNP